MFCDCGFPWAFSLNRHVFPQQFYKCMEKGRLVVPAPSDVEIESWDTRPQRPELDLDGQNLLKRLRHEGYTETGRYEPEQA